MHQKLQLSETLGKILFFPVIADVPEVGLSET
jgi:hypothetical protein